jgi:hypothetical protein
MFSSKSTPYITERDNDRLRGERLPDRCRKQLFRSRRKPRKSDEPKTGQSQEGDRITEFRGEAALQHRQSTLFVDV